MVIFAIELSLGLVLHFEPNVLQYLPSSAKVLATGILPAAIIAIALNIFYRKSYLTNQLKNYPAE
jgi:xanthine/uracil permease